jgi:hypothetical protein
MKTLKKITIWLVLYIALSYLALYDVAINTTVAIGSITSSLTAMSSILLAIVGMWVSYSYPSAVQAITTNQASSTISESYEDAERIQSLIMILLVCSFILVSILVGTAFVIPFGKSFDIYKTHHELFKGIGYCTIWFLCLIQSLAFLKIISINISFLDNLDSKIKTADIENRQNPPR